MNEAPPRQCPERGFNLSWFFPYLQMPRLWRIV